jgi:hypothetical protein
MLPMLALNSWSDPSASASLLLGLQICVTTYAFKKKKKEVNNLEVPWLTSQSTNFRLEDLNLTFLGRSIQPHPRTTESESASDKFPGAKPKYNQAWAAPPQPTFFISHNCPCSQPEINDWQAN